MGNFQSQQSEDDEDDVAVVADRTRPSAALLTRTKSNPEPVVAPYQSGHRRRVIEAGDDENDAIVLTSGSQSESPVPVDPYELERLTRERREARQRRSEERRREAARVAQVAKADAALR